jgi:NADH dehydrogenase
MGGVLDPLDDLFGNGDAPETLVEEEAEPDATARTRPIVVTGAAGLVGTHVCRELTDRGWRVRAIVRDGEKATRRIGHLPLEIVGADIRDANAMEHALRGAGAVIHLAAIAIERPGQRYEDVNASATALLLEAARAQQVDRFIHMSQNGASSASPYAFLRSKGMAEDLVRVSDRQWTILRPSVIFGPQDAFVNVLARLVRLSPVVYPLPDGGRARFQPIAATDVARVIARALERSATIGGTYALGGPAALTLRQMAERIFLAMDVQRVILPLPVSVLRPILALLQRVLPNPPVTTSLLDLLGVDNTVADNALWDVFEVEPTPFAPEEIAYLKQITVRDALRSLVRG